MEIQNIEDPSKIGPERGEERPQDYGTEAILREEAYIAISQIPMMQGASLAVAAVMTFIFRSPIDGRVAIGWFLMVLGVASIRTILYIRFRKVRGTSFDGRLWQNRYIIASLLSGIVWGAPAWLLFPPGDAVMQSLLILIIASLCAATTVSHYSIKWGPTAWCVPAMVPYSVQCFLEGGSFGGSLAILTALYLACMVMYSFPLHRAISSSIALRFENLDLLEELRRATKLKDQYVNMVSHDLRAPLANIKTYADLVNDDPGLALKSDLAGIMKNISNSSGMLLCVIDKILDIGKLRSGRIVLSRESVPLRALVREQIDNVSLLAAKKKIRFENEVEESMLAAADRILLGTVVGNLLSNAMKFSPENCVVNIFIPKGNSGSLAVKDSGIGIPANIRENLFRHEFKTVRPGTSGETGSGFGLPYASDIMRAHGGNLSVESSEGDGATFYIHFPKKEFHLLVVDDQEFQRKLVADCLAGLPAITILEADSCKAALQEIGRRVPDLIIAEAHMPEMNGLDLLSTLKKGINRSIPFIISSTNIRSGWNSSMRLHDEALHRGADDFILKPFTEGKVVSKVRKFLSAGTNLPA